MRRLFLITASLIICSFCVPYEEIPLEEVSLPSDRGVVTFKLYRHYVLSSPAFEEYPGDSIDYTPLILNADFSFKTYDDGEITELGLWRTRGDTLFLYQTESIWKDTLLSKLYHDAMQHSPEAYDMRTITSPFRQRRISNVKYAPNVAVFRVSKYGDTLTGIDDDFKHVAVNVSQKAASHTYERRPVYPLGTNNNRLLPVRTSVMPFSGHEIRERKGKRRKYDIVRWGDSINWQSVRSHLPDPVTGKIQAIEYVEKDIYRMRVDISGLIFTVVNPLFIEHGKKNPTNKEDWIKSVSSWLSGYKKGDTIEIGSLYLLEEGNKIKRYPDTIYVMDSDVKGYWIATPKERAK